MKYHLIDYSVNKLQEKQTKVIKVRHSKKFDALLVNKCIQDGIHNNPNKLITNLMNTDLTDEEVSILNFGLKHGLLLRPKENEMIAVMENVWNKISRQDILKDNHISKSRVQAALGAFTYNYLDIESRDYQLDQKKIRVLRNLKERFAILKPDKGQGVVLLSKDTYTNTVERISKDKTKFKTLNHDPTLMNLKTIQIYLKTLLKRVEITEEEEKLMRPKFVHIGRAHGFPKTHKTFTNVPPFRSIIDTSNTPHYKMGKFLANLLNPLTQNDHSGEDSFEASSRIQNISPTLFERGYVFFSFDIVSLFTNVPLDKTIKIILKIIYEDKLITTTLKKRTMKKLITDVCKKTAFSFNDNVYKQTDGVSMGSSLGPVIANIFMTELEKFILDELINDNIVKFYIRYVDDTLLLIKPEDTDKNLKKFNSIDKNIQFTVDKLLNGNVHFLDIKINGNKTDIYFKETHTDQYTHFTSNTLW